VLLHFRVVAEENMPRIISSLAFNPSCPAKRLAKEDMFTPLGKKPTQAVYKHQRGCMLRNKAGRIE